MKIGIDGRTMSDPRGEPAGIGQYTASLVDALVKLYRDDQFVLFVDHHAKNSAQIHLLEKEKNVTIVRFPFSEHKRYLPLVHSHWMVARMIKRHRLDLFHATANTLPLGYNGKSVVTMHDLAVFDHPEWFPDAQLVARTLILPKTVQKANHLIAVSQATKKDMIRLLHVPKENISVIPEGVDHLVEVKESDYHAIQKKFHLQRPYFLYVGTIEPRKNIARALRAFDALLEEHTEYQEMEFILAGKRGWKYDDVDSALKEMRFAQNVRELGYVSAEEKMVLYKEASAFLFPSLEEGFGLPVLEAQFLGVPVITSRRGGLEEIVSPETVCIDPESIVDISNAMKRVVSDTAKREKMIHSAKEYAEQFQWNDVARKTYEIYKKVTVK